MLAEFSLAGRTAVVTGGARGLGLEMLRALAEAGAKVAALDVLYDEARAAMVQVATEHNVQAIAHRVDVTDADDVERAMTAVEAELGPIDVVVAAAGVSDITPTVDVSLASWKRVIDINLTGVFLTAQSAGRRCWRAARAVLFLSPRCPVRSSTVHNRR